MRNAAGWTLMELVVGLAILGLIAAASMHFFNLRIQQEERAKADLELVRGAVETYLAKVGDYPDTIGLLVPDYLSGVSDTPLITLTPDTAAVKITHTGLNLVVYAYGKEQEWSEKAELAAIEGWGMHTVAFRADAAADTAAIVTALAGYGGRVRLRECTGGWDGYYILCRFPTLADTEAIAAALSLTVAGENRGGL